MAACCGLEHLLGGIVEVVATDAANKKRREMGKGEKVSGGIDSWGRMRGSVLERLQGGVGLQRLRNMLGALSTDPVGPDTASESQKDTSGGADGREKVVRRPTRGSAGWSSSSAPRRRAWRPQHRFCFPRYCEREPEGHVRGC